MKKEDNRKNNFIYYRNLPKSKAGWMYFAFLFSFILHFSFWNKLESFNFLPKKSVASEKVKIRYKSNPKKIVETKMTPTEKPEGKSRLGAQNHKTLKETRIRNDVPRPKGAVAGQLGLDPNGRGRSLSKPNLRTQNTANKTNEKKIGRSSDKVLKPRNKYEALMPQSIDLADSRRAGYQDYVDENIDIGDSIDLNTTDYRYIGYFSGLRRAFDMVWSYPSEAARRGIAGSVVVRFTILKTGKLKYAKIVDSSGYEMLDAAVIEALELAAPYDPLPEGFDKDKLTVTGSFKYVLSGFASAH